MAKKRSRNDKETNYDVEFALGLHERYNPLGVTENAVFPDNRNFEDYEPKTLIDQTLEIIDPTPNIYTLFGQFNARFFSNKLLSVEVKWSHRMTSCAGICSFHPRSRDCIISLSAPLLKLRPRKDLVETLLHEMIHGYLFLTNNNRDRDGHGPEFLKIMDRINKEAGTQISVYHSFHDEVKLYQQHWWRCDGPCQKQPPFFGTVRRAMNRAPGPSDFWWASHKARCDGTFIKVREPEKKIEDKKSKGKVADKKASKNLDDYFTNKNKKPEISGGVKNWMPTLTAPPNSKLGGATGKALPAGLVKLGTNTNNVHGWGTGGPGSSSAEPSFSQKKSNDKSGRTLNFSGTLGGSGTGKSNILDKFSSPKQPTSSVLIIEDSPPTKKSKITDSESLIKYNCPVCNSRVDANQLNEHLDVCLSKPSRTNEKKLSVIEILDSPEKRNNRAARKSITPPFKALKGQTNLDSFVISTPEKTKKNTVSCPACDKIVFVTELYDHLDSCTLSWQGGQKSTEAERRESDTSRPQTSRKNSTTKTNLNESYVCLVCNVKISGDIALNDHLEECVKAIFNDDTFDVGNDTFLEISSPKADLVNGRNSADSSLKIDLTDDKFPCPICMDLIQEHLMNEHLDNCLKAQK
ncbi:DNA-dependent metalloprotease dvc-1 [Venturia canescens]|uniref:DNA-dependent metalloprotease dvc-1 n=1 Tax=Venturia canescens TaxID=32260 RepID=UPI001C9C56EF|nr:DNA-dependent metalloprotease dvc-1 [Venturia canescens]